MTRLIQNGDSGTQTTGPVFHRIVKCFVKEANFRKSHNGLCEYDHQNLANRSLDGCFFEAIYADVDNGVQ